jgi:beta-lactam-binding protein with PASTA domain
MYTRVQRENVRMHVERLALDSVVEPESDRKDADRHEGLVWKQSPAGGSKARKGSTVTIWVNPD